MANYYKLGQEPTFKMGVPPMVKLGSEKKLDPPKFNGEFQYNGTLEFNGIRPLVK